MVKSADIRDYVRYGFIVGEDVKELEKSARKASEGEMPLTLKQGIKRRIAAVEGGNVIEEVWEITLAIFSVDGGEFQWNVFLEKLDKVSGQHRPLVSLQLDQTLCSSEIAQVVEIFRDALTRDCYSDRVFTLLPSYGSEKPEEESLEMKQAKELHGRLKPFVVFAP